MTVHAGLLNPTSGEDNCPGLPANNTSFALSDDAGSGASPSAKRKGKAIPNQPTTLRPVKSRHFDRVDWWVSKVTLADDLSCASSDAHHSHGCA